MKASDLSGLSLIKLKALYLKAQDTYYNSTDGATIMSDAVFNRLENMIRDKDPDWEFLSATGGGVGAGGKKFKRDLDVPMPSLRKLYPHHEKEFVKWNTKHNEGVASAKLDGSSIQVKYAGKPVALNTRGNGVVGKSIDHFIAALVRGGQLPARLPVSSPIYLRMEAVVPYLLWKKKYSKEFASARAMASALFNRSDIHPAILAGDVHLVVLRVDGPSLMSVSYSAALAKAKAWGFTVVPRIASDISPAALSTLLGKMQSKVPYEIDGLVVVPDYKMSKLPVSGDKPDHSFAYKENDEAEAPITEVLRVEYRVTKHRIVPLAHIKPTEFDGTTVRKVTVNNMKWMIDRGVGPGAVVRIVRSGEIIPKIVAVLKPVKVKTPTASEVGAEAIAWKGTDMIVVEHSDASRDRQMTLMVKTAFSAIGIEHVSTSAAAGLAGLENVTPLKVINMLYGPRAMDYLTHVGISPKIAEKALATLPRSLPIEKVMYGSCIFGQGLGRTLLTRIVNLKTPRVAYGGPVEKIEPSETEVQAAVGPVAAEKWARLAPKFWKDLKTCAHLKSVIQYPSTVKAKPKKGPLSGVCVSMTGYRDKDQEAKILAAGGEVVDYGSRTQVLLYSPTGKASTKVAKAKERGIRVCLFKDLLK